VRRLIGAKQARKGYNLNVNTVASRAAALALLFLGALVATGRPAAARHEPANAPVPVPTETPIYFPMTPPTTTPATMTAAVPQQALMASSFCQNDRFLAQRAVPQPQEFNVAVCGLVYAVSPGKFEIAIDGSQPIPVSGKDAGSVQVGESVFVVGSYRNTAKSIESIDATGGVSPLPAVSAPTSS
jgi:hypothetical protein